MLFNSYIFILLFLPISIGGYFLLCKTKHKILPKLFLLGMSFWFYAYFNIKYFPIIVLSILLNYFLGLFFKKVKATSARRLLLLIGLLLNLGVLFYYKYLGFCTENINALFGSDFNVVHLVLPLGISFFTFQQVSYVIDCYKNTVPDYNFIDYALFVTFFPQLIAGPIVLHSEIIPQFADEKNLKFNSENFAKGLTAFTLGLAKKVLIADTFGKVVALGFADIGSLNSASAFAAMLAYTFQIYFDFSGYCDMATGIGLFFNINIPQNFNSPYRALDISDFWSRWHITLTRFLRSNIYIPLGGNRKGTLRTYLNVFIVFLASGVWHGANWTFILWGIMHGVAMIITRIFSKQLNKLPSWLKPLRLILTFAFIALTWVYFRADSLSDANEMIVKIFSFTPGGISAEFFECFNTSEFNLISEILERIAASLSPIFEKSLLFIFFAFAAFASIFMKNTNERLTVYKPSALCLTVTFVLFIWSLLSLSQVSTFLYFNF